MGDRDFIYILLKRAKTQKKNFPQMIFYSSGEILFAMGDKICHGFSNWDVIFQGDF